MKPLVIIVTLLVAIQAVNNFIVDFHKAEAPHGDDQLVD
jgi:hypothetical protein